MATQLHGRTDQAFIQTFVQIHANVCANNGSRRFLMLSMEIDANISCTYAGFKVVRDSHRYSAISAYARADDVHEGS